MTQTLHPASFSQKAVAVGEFIWKPVEKPLFGDQLKPAAFLAIHFIRPGLQLSHLLRMK